MPRPEVDAHHSERESPAMVSGASSLWASGRRQGEGHLPASCPSAGRRNENGEEKRVDLLTTLPVGGAVVVFAVFPCFKTFLSARATVEVM